MSDNEIRIIRVDHNQDNPYFLMNRRTAQDESLSWEARGVLAYLLSKPDDWQVMVSDLQQQCGRDKVKSILKELETAKYLTVERDQHDNEGHFAPNHYVVHETPFTENPLTAKPLTANPLLHNTEGQSTEEQSSVSPEKKKPKPDPEFNVIAEVWKNSAGGWVSNMQGMMFGTKRVKGEWLDCQFSPPATVDEVRDFEVYARKRDKEGNLPTKPPTIQRWFYDFRTEKSKPTPSVLDGLRLVS